MLVGAGMVELQVEGEAYLDRMRVPATQRVLEFTAEVRYARQVWQLTLPVDKPHFESDADLAAFVETSTVATGSSIPCAPRRTRSR